MALKGSGKQCTAKSKRSGKRCEKWAVLGYSVCHMHGARGGEQKNRNPKIVHGRRQNLSAIFGQKFDHLAEAADALRDFETDNALFLMREDELANRTKVGDSKRYRERILAGLQEAIVAFSEEDYTALAQTLVKLEELANNGVQHDVAFEHLLQNSERRVRVSTQAITALARENTVLTMKDMATAFGLFFNILVRELGEDHAYRINKLFEREVLTPMGCVESGDSEYSGSAIRN